MGLKRIVGIRQFTWFTPAGKMQRKYRVTFETDKTDGAFTFDLVADEYTKDKAISMAKARAYEIDATIEGLGIPPAPQ